jgi:hypothetical protein
MDDIKQSSQAAYAQDRRTEQSAFPFTSDQVPDGRRSKARSATLPEVEAERCYFKHLGRDLAARLLGREVPREVAVQYFQYSRNIAASQTSAKRMGDLIGFGWALLDFQQRRQETSQSGQGELSLGGAVRLPRLSEKYPGLDSHHAEKVEADAIEAGRDSDLPLEDRVFLAQLHRGRLAQQRQSVNGFAYDLLMKSYEQGIVAPAAKKAYAVFVEASRATRSNEGLTLLWAAFEQLYSSVDWFDYDRKGDNARNVFKNANRTVVRERERAEREVSNPSAQPFQPQAGDASIPEDDFQHIWKHASPEERQGRDAKAAANLERMMSDLQEETDVLGRCQVRDPRVEEYFVVAFHPGYQTVDLVVDSHNPDRGLTRLESWVREVNSRNPQKVLVRDLKMKLDYIATHPGTTISMRSPTGIGVKQ